MTDNKGQSADGASVEQRRGPSRRRWVSAVTVLALALAAGIAAAKVGLSADGDADRGPALCSALGRTRHIRLQPRQPRDPGRFRGRRSGHEPRLARDPSRSSPADRFRSLFPKHSRRRVGALSAPLASRPCCAGRPRLPRFYGRRCRRRLGASASSRRTDASRPSNGGGPRGCLPWRVYSLWSFLPRSCLRHPWVGTGSVGRATRRARPRSGM